MKNCLLCLCFVLFSISTSYAQKTLKSRVDKPKMAQSKVVFPQDVKDHLETRIAQGTDVGIAVALINGDSVEFYNVGETAIKNGGPIDQHSVFEIGSISKVFTTTLLANEVLSGTMKLSDPIQLYLPADIKSPSRNGREITLLDLATHSSSLPRMPSNFEPADPANPYVDYTTQQMLDFLKSYTLTEDIGSKSDYSNYGVGLLGYLIAEHNNTTYERLMIDKIADACNMDFTRVTLTESMENHLALGHDNGKEVSNWDLGVLAGAGGIRSTTSDMVKFLKANMRVLPTTITKAMNFAQNVAYTSPAKDFEMGLGWQYMKTPNSKLIWHNGGTGGYRAFVGFIENGTKGVVVLGNSTLDIGSIGVHLLDPAVPLDMPKKSINSIIEKEITNNGIDAAIQLYHNTLESEPDAYDFEDDQLNALGYSYMNKNEMAIAIALFKLNVEQHPKASNPYDSLAEAYLKQGDSAQAVVNYTKALQLNPANTNAKQYLINLGVDPSAIVTDVIVAEEVLESYVGRYELAPTFIIAVTRKDNQLLAQATGQPQFELFASGENEFYLKVVEARVTFNADNEGKIVSLTLYQNGKDIQGKKMEQ